MLELVGLSLTRDIGQLFGNICKYNTYVYYTIQCITESPEINFVRCFTSDIVLGEHRVDKGNIPADGITCSKAF